MLTRGSVLVRKCVAPHPVLERAKRVLHGLAAHAHHLRLTVQSLLHGLQYRLVSPALESPITAGRAIAAYWAARTRRTPVSIQLEAVLHCRETLDRTLASGTAVLVMRFHTAWTQSCLFHRAGTGPDCVKTPVSPRVAEATSARATYEAIHRGSEPDPSQLVA